ncbi:MAG: hypothetical protein QNJ47_25465 [Nostocaceae cyanobacterium]|nr:hypothetical protein [Nostocaceae cyanobacterium]
MNSTNDKIKESVTKEFINQLRQDSYKRADELSENVVKQLAKIKEAVNQELGKEIQSIHDQVKSILDEKQKGQANVDAQLIRLAGVRHKLEQIDRDLDELIAEVAVL